MAKKVGVVFEAEFDAELEAEFDAVLDAELDAEFEAFETAPFLSKIGFCGFIG